MKISKMDSQDRDSEPSHPEGMAVDENARNTHESDDEGGLRIDDDIYIPPPPRKQIEMDVFGPRIMIDKIVNENFKSYAGQVTVGLFDECFSAIMGPNGSGKSNVIDSMLFVFGYRASKIRLKKISELIHNSSKHRDIRSCTVSVHFRKIIDKGDGTFERVPNSEIIISRTAFKDSSSYYELNKRKVQFKEIANLLRSEGVDLDHNRFLILQGEVEQIALMKPKGPNDQETGMLEFLEDIIGTTRYKVPLEKLAQNVEIMTERRIEVLNRVRAVEAEREALAEPMEEVIEYLKQENEIIKLQHELYQCKKVATSDDVNEQRIKKDELHADHAALLEEMKKVREEKEAKMKELQEKCKDWDALQKQMDKATAKHDEIRKKDEALHAELIETNKRRKTNAASVKTEKENLENLQKVPEKNAASIKECEDLVKKSVASREKEEKTLQVLMESSREKTEPLLNDRRDLETKLIALRNDVDQAKAACDLAESEYNIYTSVEESEKRKLQELRDAYQNTIETLKQRKENLRELETKIPATKRSLSEAKSELADVKNRESEATAKLKGMRVQFEEKKSAMNANRSRNRVIDSLMEEKRAGRMPGIFGRLGDLGAIDGKFDVAISTACGALDSVIVDTVATANSCIEFLRKNDIGRATFVPVEKQQRFAAQCRQKISTPENVSRLFDLIKVEDERVLPVFYYALRNTLVANDLDQATRIAYGAQRFRVVTLKGEVIETSGTMSGGGKTVMRGRMGQSVVREEMSAVDIERLQQNLDAVYEECNRLRARQQALEDQVRTLEKGLNDAMMDRDKCEIELKALTIQEPSLKSQIKLQEEKSAKCVASPQKVKALKHAIDVAQKKYNEAKESSRETEEAVARLSKEIEKLSGGPVKEQQKKIAALSTTISKAEAEILRLEVAIKTADRNTKKSEKKIEFLEKEVRACEERLLEIKNEKTELESVAIEIRKELDELSEGLTERDEIQGTYKADLNALTTRESKMKAMKIDLDVKVRDFDKKFEDLEALLSDYSRKISSMKLRDIPGQVTQALEELSEEQIRELESKEISARLQRAKQKLPEEIPNMQIIKQYQALETHYLNRVSQLDEITEQRNKLRDTYDMVRRRRCEEFLAGFVVITEKLKQMYQMITLDGDAELELVDSMDPFSEGIVFSVRPPKKSWKNISNLSGGEKTLSSLALVFALHHYKPSPLYFMDEIDAALDFKNISIVGNYIKDRAKNSQFIIISLRDNMFELANTLVGIYKTNDATKSVTINVNDFIENNEDDEVRSQEVQK